MWGESEMWRLTMRYEVFCRWILVALGVLSIGFMGGPVPAGAQLIGTLGTTIVLFDTGKLAAGTSDTLDAGSDSASISTLLLADVPSAAVIGYADQLDSTASLGTLNLSIGAINITADSVVAEVETPLGAWGAGISFIDNLSINGVSIRVDGSVNQTVAIPNGQMVINEQRIAADGTITVNALHVAVNGVADIVVASAMAGARGGDALAVRATTF
jgi:hypothetical protein